jgi:hypothetical protein
MYVLQVLLIKVIEGYRKCAFDFVNQSDNYIGIFVVITLCHSLVGGCQHFRGIYYLYPNFYPDGGASSYVPSKLW